MHVSTMDAVTDLDTMATTFEPNTTDEDGGASGGGFRGFGPPPLNFEANAIAQIGNAVLITFGNSWVILAVALNRHKLWNPLILMMLNLAIVDLLVGLFAEVTSAYNSLEGITNKAFCTFKLVWSLALARISMLGYGLLSAERFVAIRYPYRHPVWFTSRNATLMWVGIWIIAFVYSSAMVVTGMQERWAGRCVFGLVVSTEVLVYFAFPVIYVTEAVAIACIYAYLFFVVRRQLREIAKMQVNEKTDSTKKEMKVAVRCLSMIVLQLVCQWPLPIKDVLDVAFGIKASLRTTYSLLWMKRLNSALNPLCFAYTYAPLWGAMRKMLPVCMQRQGRVDPEGPSSLQSMSLSTEVGTDGPP